MRMNEPRNKILLLYKIWILTNHDLKFHRKILLQLSHPNHHKDYIKFVKLQQFWAPPSPSTNHYMTLLHNLHTIETIFFDPRKKKMNNVVNNLVKNPFSISFYFFYTKFSLLEDWQIGYGYAVYVKNCCSYGFFCWLFIHLFFLYVLLILL